MIYGTEAIPAGTTFFSLATVVSPYEHAVLAFKAIAFLMEQYGYVGGMTGRGHGKIMFDFIYTDKNGSQKLYFCFKKACPGSLVPQGLKT
ncbi:MAG: hypothetical protein H0Z40_11840 [Desulfotomaculum sp.]|nr:hypothetical protein [Desulfotomaculum sp.]